MNKPHIKLIGGVWRCQSADVMNTGPTPRQAFNRWLEATIKAGLEHYGRAEALVELPKPKRERARSRPQKPKALDGLDIPVFVAEPRTINALQRPALSLQSVGLRLNGSRALEAQPKTPSLAGGRRGGE
ncbi:hypothetical protein [Achromobacter sp. NFACC18-2]|uniref:hypothetical protein n=1 Tax=Achromobacter sp. NFACC18-2 TaxID=1564112 RepID=UPI0008D1F583|nr:hypothetical protein [Achromobacter sp. NFACC18-2]SEJ99897.1 hypothetical protein SAMN03159494_04247 [Achromobacter sp. NFACC18-2]